MDTEDTWFMHGLDFDDPGRVKSISELLSLVDELGFLPLFRNSVPGFSVEERTYGPHWFTGIESVDPWEWRRLAARSGRVAYGKFFDKKAGFISKEWLPYFCNWRRDGYDFDSRRDEGLTPVRENRLMDVIIPEEEVFSFRLKELAGFGKGGEKNFEGVLTGLEMQTYALIRDFRQRRNKYGEPYGWDIAVLSTPEHVFGEETVTSAYGESPEVSKNRIYARARELNPGADEKALHALLK